jgi:hypothetical protein
MLPMLSFASSQKQCQAKAQEGKEEAKGRKKNEGRMVKKYFKVKDRV